MRNIVFSVLAGALPLCLAQTATTTCNPLSTSNCSPDTALNTGSFSSSWTSGSSLSGWTTTAGSVAFDSSGAEFVIHKEGDAPTIQTDFYIFYGYFEVTMRAASGTGIVSSVVMLSDVNDEIDWEFTGGDTTQTQTNYFGKGYTGDYDRAVWYSVAAPQTQFHTYAVNWTADAISWIIDGTTVRTLVPADADGGVHFPQTPMRCKLGIWAGGDPSNAQGTIEWAGGLTDFSDAPFTMTVQSIKIENYSPGSSYTYKDETGDASSIEVSGGSTDSNAGGEFASSDSSSSSAAPTTTSAAAPKSSSTDPKAATTSAPSSSTASSVVSKSVKISSSIATKALSTIPLAASTSKSGSSHTDTSASGGSTISASSSVSAGGSGSGSASGSQSASASASHTGSSAGAKTMRSENALVALMVFVLAAFCVV